VQVSLGHETIERPPLDFCRTTAGNRGRAGRKSWDYEQAHTSVEAMQCVLQNEPELMERLWI
jgi:hypothetical protein